MQGGKPRSAGSVLGAEVTVSHLSPQGFAYRSVHSHHIDLAFIPGDALHHFNSFPILPRR